MKRLSSVLARRDIVTLGVQGLVTDEARRVLLVRHEYRPGWHFPGGGVERGESIERALGRELLEETGIVALEPLRLIGIYANFKGFPGDHIVVIAADRWLRDHVPAPNAEIAEHGFFALDGLPAELAPGTARRLQEVFACAAHSQDW